jgi:hypothetical protein
MENFYDVIDMIESTYEIKLMHKPYTFNPKPFHNMELDRQCIICNRTIGLYEMVHKDKNKHIVCQQCHYEHIAGVNFSTYKWFKKTYIDIEDKLDQTWLALRESDLVEFTNWLKNHNEFKNTLYLALEKPDKKVIPRLKAIYIPQSYETIALNVWLHGVGVNTIDCTFRTLDSFPSFKNIFEDIIVIYNNPNKTHSKKDGSPLQMKLNPISKILGENIKGTIVFVDQRLIIDDVFNDDYRLDYMNKREHKI